MRIAIVGARAHPNLDLVREYVRALPADTLVVSGGADGVDSEARDAAEGCGLATVTYHPWDREVETINTRPWPEGGGRSSKYDLQRIVVEDTREALLLRNTLIAISCDRMVVFPDGSKGGCWDAAREAKRFRRPVEVRWCDGRVESYPRGVP